LKLGFVRAIAYAGVFLLVAIALTYVPQLPDRRPADTLVSQAASPSWKMRFDTLGHGETLQRVFRRAGLSDSAVYHAIKAASLIDERKVKENMAITFRTAVAESEPSEVILELAIDRLVHLKRDSTGWKESVDTLRWTTDTIAVSGTIQTNVYAAMYASAGTFLPRGACDLLTVRLAEDVYGYKIDFIHELRRGDQFKVLAERSVGPHNFIKIGHILAASFTLSGSELKAVRFESKGGGGDYFDEDGKSMRAMFMKYPVQFSRISSSFSSSRLHPILGYSRAHKGTDFAAEEGTPVMAIGDGTVLRATWSDGYGNLAEIRHPNGYVTRYGHMRAFKGIHAGSHVTMGQTIGYVGQTGLATGPHLHFEVLINGEQHNPVGAFARTSGQPVPKTELAAYAAARDAILPQVGQIPSNRAYAMNASSNAVQAGQAQPQKPR
jgi:murein DD-endopeptidase MepM/ murein hydrolase activator NlpD